MLENHEPFRSSQALCGRRTDRLEAGLLFEASKDRKIFGPGQSICKSLDHDLTASIMGKAPQSHQRFCEQICVPNLTFDLRTQMGVYILLKTLCFEVFKFM